MASFCLGRNVVAKNSVIIASITLTFKVYIFWNEHLRVTSFPLWFFPYLSSPLRLVFYILRVFPRC